MVSEAKLKASVLHAFPDMHGDRDDIWVRLTDDQCPSNRAIMG
jgi:hypothetical protein